MNPSPATKTLRVDLPQNIQVSQQTLRRFVCFAETNLVVVVRGSALNKHIIIISLFKALPWTTTTKLINSHQKKLMENSFSFKCRHFHSTERNSYLSITWKENICTCQLYKINTVPISKLKRRSQIAFYCTCF